MAGGKAGKDSGKSKQKAVSRYLIYSKSLILKILLPIIEFFKITQLLFLRVLFAKPLPPLPYF